MALRMSHVWSHEIKNFPETSWAWILPWQSHLSTPSIMVSIGMLFVALVSLHFKYSTMMIGTMSQCHWLSNCIQDISLKIARNFIWSWLGILWTPSYGQVNWRKECPAPWPWAKSIVAERSLAIVACTLLANHCRSVGICWNHSPSIQSMFKSFEMNGFDFVLQDSADSNWRFQPCGAVPFPQKSPAFELWTSQCNYECCWVVCLNLFNTLHCTKTCYIMLHSCEQCDSRHRTTCLMSFVPDRPWPHNLYKHECWMMCDVGIKI